jgi:DNA invertase Pin-like site-specific DNA recombinase
MSALHKVTSVRAVPTLPLAGYGRVSRVGDRDRERLLSPDQQQEAVERKARQEGVELRWFGVEIDVSGSKVQRKVLDEILEGIEAAQLGGLIVSRLDRLSRLKPRDRVELVDRIESAGAVLLSAAENIDPSTPEGRFARDVFFGVARMEWERYRDSFDNAKRSAMARGAAVMPTPFGYARDPRGVLIEHPERAEHLREAFRRAAEQSLQAATVYLDSLNLTREGGKLQGQRLVWTASTVRRMLANRVYLGTARYGELSTKVPALVTRQQWQAAQPDAAIARQPPAEFPLSGLASCASCGNHLVGGRGGPDARRMYRCAAGLTTFKGDRCQAPAAISAGLLEDHVRSLLVAALEADPLRTDRADDTAEYDTAQVEVQRLEAELDGLTADTDLRNTIGPDRFRRLVDSVATKLAEAEQHLASLTRPASTLDEFPVADLVREAQLHELGRFLVVALDSVTVARGRIPVGERVKVRFAWREP